MLSITSASGVITAILDYVLKDGPTKKKWLYGLVATIVLSFVIGCLQIRSSERANESDKQELSKQLASIQQRADDQAREAADRNAETRARLLKLGQKLELLNSLSQSRPRYPGEEAALEAIHEELRGLSIKAPSIGATSTPHQRGTPQVTEDRSPGLAVYRPPPWSNQPMIGSPVGKEPPGPTVDGRTEPSLASGVAPAVDTGWSPFPDYDQAGGAKLIVVFGDLSRTEPTGVLMAFPAGSKQGMHRHSLGGSYGVVVQGVVHNLMGMSGEKGPALKPGSFWSLRDEAHDHYCDAEDGCIAFMYMRNGWDFRRVEPSPMKDGGDYLQGGSARLQNRATAAADVKWIPIGSNDTESGGAKVAVVFGDLGMKSPLGAMISLPADSKQSIDIGVGAYGLVIQGVVRNLNSVGAKSSSLGAGAHWYQGKQPGNFQCETGTGCIIFLYMPRGWTIPKALR